MLPKLRADHKCIRQHLTLQWRMLQGKPKDWVVADFGCGYAAIGAKAAQKVHLKRLVNHATPA